MMRRRWRLKPSLFWVLDLHKDRTMRQRPTPAIAILLLISVGLACSLPRGKRPLTWHIMLEIDAAVPDRKSAVTQTVTVIERRLDAAAVYNFEVLAQGTPPNGRILVNL